ncbi:hypothetical protein ACWC0A_39730, partial [Streptomyces scopuliridis]
MVADHLAEAGACCGELVFEFGHAACEAIDLGGLGADQGFQLGFGPTEFVDPGSKIGGADLVELLAEVEAGIARMCFPTSSNRFLRSTRPIWPLPPGDLDVESLRALIEDNAVTSLFLTAGLFRV